VDICKKTAKPRPVYDVARLEASFKSAKVNTFVLLITLKGVNSYLLWSGGLRNNWEVIKQLIS